MNRNTELHFQNTPQINLKRSKFDKSHSIKTTFNTGDIVPFFVDADILPGTTVQMDMAELIRMATPIYPIMDNAFVDIYFFFTPNRLLWDHWTAFWGENDDPWTQTQKYTIPQIEAPVGGWTEGTIADYMGIPTKVSKKSVNALPMRAYCKIYNDWFRSEAVQYCVHMYTDDTTRSGKNGTEVGYDPITDTELGGKPLKANKFHDMFTSCLPEPQKGDPVMIPMGTTAIVKAGKTNNLIGDTDVYPLTYGKVTNGFSGHTYEQIAATPQTLYGLGMAVTPSGSYDYSARGQLVNSNELDQQPVENYGAAVYLTPDNLVADLREATAVTINELRTAFAIQRYLENAGLVGTRYIEYIRGVFGVTSSDARLQRSEYIGGMRCPINVDQIIQTSSTDATTPQGNAAGFSCTINRDSLFTKSFEEHGVLMGLLVVRTDHTYQQGIERQWTRKTWLDYYNPFFANLGNQAVRNDQIFAQGTSADEEAFGYQEAWAEYRWTPSKCTGYMRSNATGSLDVWHFADDYSSQPYLSSDWLEETEDNVDRTIAVTTQLTHQFIADLYLRSYYTLPMPVYSVPGLIDHV